MISFFVVALAIGTLITAIIFYRVAAGRTVYDRLLAAGAVGTNAIVLLTLTGFVFERPDMFVDLALTYALLNFIGTVAVGKYFENRRDEEQV